MSTTTNTHWRGRESRTEWGYCRRRNDAPEDALEELVRAIEQIGQQLRLHRLDEEVSGPSTAALPELPPRLSPTVSMTFVHIGRRPPLLAVSEDAEFLDDPGRITVPARPTRTVTMRFVHVGRQPPRISEDAEG